MLETYHSLEKIVADGHTDQIKQELNAYPLYTWMVQLFGFREIGIVALDEIGNKIAEYASRNNELGEIIEIRPYFTAPSISVQAREKDLLEILHHADWVKEHPIRAIVQYAGKFSLQQGTYRTIRDYVLVFCRNAVRENTFGKWP